VEWARRDYAVASPYVRSQFIPRLEGWVLFVLSRTTYVAEQWKNTELKSRTSATVRTPVPMRAAISVAMDSTTRAHFFKWQYQ
jgi:hypothetical protein